MSRFYGDIHGNRGQATRCGTAASGMSGHLRGWNTGARVEVIDIEGKDVVRVYRTSGSSGGKSEMLLAEYGEDTPYLKSEDTKTISALESAVEYCGKPFNKIDGAQAENAKIACQKALDILKGGAY